MFLKFTLFAHYETPIAMGLQNKKKIGFSRLKFKKVCLRAPLAPEEETQHAEMKIKLPILGFNERITNWIVGWLPLGKKGVGRNPEIGLFSLIPNRSKILRLQ